MTKFKASRSFFGDLGNIKRNQIVEIPDVKDKTAARVIARGLLVPLGGAAVEVETKGKAKAKQSDGV